MAQVIEVVEIYFYPTYTVLVYSDGHEEVIEIENTHYVQEVENQN